MRTTVSVAASLMSSLQPVRYVIWSMRGKIPSASSVLAEMVALGVASFMASQAVVDHVAKKQG